MEQDPQNKHERGGRAGEASIGDEKAEKRKERFNNWFKARRKSPEKDEAPKPVKNETTFSEFVLGIVKRDDRSASEREGWIDQAFRDRQERIGSNEQLAQSAHRSDQEKLAELSEQERTEFHMIVAERFREAGERFMRFVRGEQQPATEVASIDTSVDKGGVAIGEVRAMYEDPSVEQGGSVQPVESAPPFDFAVSARAPERLSQSESSSLPSTPDIPTVASHPIDVFDYGPASHLEDARRRVAVEKDGDVKTVVYRPRTRDLLFAGLAGGYIGSRLERRRGKRAISKLERSQKEALKVQAKEFEAARARLHEEQQRLRTDLDTAKSQTETNRQHIAHAVKTGPEVLEVVQKAARQFIKEQDTVPPELRADPVRAAEKLARAERPVEQPVQASKPVEELEFRNLKPASTQPIQHEDAAPVQVAREAETLHTAVQAKVGESSLKPHTNERIEQATSSAVEAERSVAPVDSLERTEVAAPASGHDAASLGEILAQRGGPSSAARHRRAEVRSSAGAQKNRPGSGQATTNWAPIAVILGLVLIGLIFAISV